MDKNNYTSRIEKRKIEQENREELKRVIFDEKPKKKSKKLKEKNMPKTVRIFLSLTMVSSFAFVGYLLYDSINQKHQLYQIINAIVILFTTIGFLLAFKKSYFENKTKATIFTSICILILFGFNLLYNTKIISLPVQNYVPDFNNKSLTEVMKWTEENNIEYEQVYEYSDTTDKYNIISQDVKPNTLTKNINKINLEISSGPDYNKETIITDMTGWNIDEVVKVIDDNFLNNVSVNFEDNPETVRGIVLNQSKSGSVKRNDAISFTVSLGDSNAIGDLIIKDLKNIDIFKAKLYLDSNMINYEIKYEFSNKIKKGKVIKQSIKKGTKVTSNDKVTLTVSKGKKVIVPNLVNMKISEVTKWIIENDLKINYSDKYSNDIKNGRIIEATYKKGEVLEQGDTIGIVVSKGKLKMPKFSSLSSFKSWASKYEIKYEIKEEFNENVKQGEIIKFSVKTGKKINPDDTLIVYTSKGTAIEVPNFTGKSKKEAQKSCNTLGLVCSFINEYNSSKEDVVLSQSVKAGEEVAKGSTIQINIATKNKNNVTTVITNKSNTSKSTTNASTTNKSSSNKSNSSSSSNKVTCTKSTYTINLNNIFNSYNGYDTVYKELKKLETKYPGITVYVSSDPTSDMSSGSFVSGFSKGNVNCPGSISITIAK